MNRLGKNLRSVMFSMKLFEVIAVTCLFIGCWQSKYPAARFYKAGNYLVILSYLILFVGINVIYRGFRIGPDRLHEVIYSQSLTVVFTNVLMYIELCLIARMGMNPLPMLICTVAQFVVICICCYSATGVYYRLFKARHILAIMPDDEAGRSEALHIIRRMQKINERFCIHEAVSTAKPIEKIKSDIKNYEAVLLCTLEPSVREELMNYCYTEHKRLYILPDSNDIILNSTFPLQISDCPVLVCRNRGLTADQTVIKRGFDILISGLMLILLSPLFLLVSLGIKLCDRGPVFYKQERVTENNRLFDIYKFRSMVVDAEADGAQKAVDNDDRITLVGKIIRPLRIDELPQLINVIKGDMSLVGPRPERVENVEEYCEILPDFNLRHKVRAGLTGYAQIYGKYNTSPKDKLNMDLIYIENYSVLGDLKLLVMTIKILFQKESTEGFKDE